MAGKHEGFHEAAWASRRREVLEGAQEGRHRAEPVVEPVPQVSNVHPLFGEILAPFSPGGGDAA